MRGAGQHQVAAALPEHRHFPIITLLGPGHLCVPPRLRPAPSFASVTTALWAAAFAGNDILDIIAVHLMAGPPSRLYCSPFLKQFSKVFLLQNDSAVTQFVTPHRPVYCASKVTGNCYHLSSLQANHHLRVQVISCIIRKSRNSYTLQVCPYLNLMVHVCLKAGHVGLLGGQPIPSP